MEWSVSGNGCFDNIGVGKIKVAVVIEEAIVLLVKRGGCLVICEAAVCPGVCCCTTGLKWPCPIAAG